MCMSPSDSNSELLIRNAQGRECEVTHHRLLRRVFAISTIQCMRTGERRELGGGYSTFIVSYCKAY